MGRRSGGQRFLGVAKVLSRFCLPIFVFTLLFVSVARADTRSFDGSNDQQVIDNPNVGSSAWSMCLWLYASSWNAGTQIVSYGTGSARGFSFSFHSTDSIRGRVFITGPLQNELAGFTTSTWYHFCFTHASGGGWKWYVDATDATADRTDSDGATYINPNSTDDFVIAGPLASDGAGNGYGAFRAAHVAYWNTELSGPQVASMADKSTCPTSVAASNLKIFVPEVDGTTTDESGSGFTVTESGSPGTGTAPSGLPCSFGPAPSPTPSPTPGASPTPTPDPSLEGEICGNGYDDTDSGHDYGSCPTGWMDAVYGGVGCDLKCPSPDADGDGHTTTGTGSRSGHTEIDCDDTDRRVIPGAYVPNSWTSPTGYKLCQTDGTYGSTVLNSTTPLCEKTGSGHCYYVSYASGNDSTGNGSYATPWKTMRMVGHWDSGAPSGHVNLVAGDVVYLLDGGNYTDKYDAGEGDVAAAVTVFETDGTSSDKITIKRYPGATVQFNPSCNSGTPCRFINVTDSDYVKLEDLVITNTYRAPIYGPGGANNMEISRIICHTNDGVAADNMSCINWTGSNTINIHNSVFYDNADSAVTAGDNSNTGNVVVFGSATDGRAVTFSDNVSFWTNPTTTSTWKHGFCFKYKHGCSGVGCAFNFKNNVMWNCQGGLFMDTSVVQALNNRIFTSENPLRWENQGGTTACPKDVVIKNWTAVDCPIGDGSGIIKYNPDDQCSAANVFTVSDNVFDTDQTLNSERNMFRMCNTCSDADFTKYITGGLLSFERNCYNSRTTALSSTDSFNIFGDNGSTSFGNRYSFSQWQGLGYDTTSFAKDPLFDSYHRATDPDCDDAGWLRVADESGGGGPDPGVPIAVGIVAIIIIVARRRRRA